MQVYIFGNAQNCILVACGIGYGDSSGFFGSYAQNTTKPSFAFLSEFPNLHRPRISDKLPQIGQLRFDHWLF